MGKGQEVDVNLSVLYSMLIKILFYLELSIRIRVKENAPRTDGKAEEVAYSSPSISLSLSLSLCLFLSLFIYIYIDR